MAALFSALLVASYATLSSALYRSRLATALILEEFATAPHSIFYFGEIGRGACSLHALTAVRSVYPDLAVVLSRLNHLPCVLVCFSCSRCRGRAKTVVYYCRAIILLMVTLS